MHHKGVGALGEAGGGWRIKEAMARGGTREDGACPTWGPQACVSAVCRMGHGFERKEVGRLSFQLEKAGWIEIVPKSQLGRRSFLGNQESPLP